MKKQYFIVAVMTTIVLGFVLGFFVFFPKVKADTPPEREGAAAPAPSVIWDETWEAQQVCYVTASGYRCDAPANIVDETAGEIERIKGVPHVRYHPKAKVVQWNVRGHLHFP